MNTIAFKLCEQTGINRSNALNSISIPLAKGELNNTNNLIVECAEFPAPIPSQFQVLAYWPDQSIKYLLVYFIANINSNTSQTYHLSEQASTKDSDSNTSHYIVEIHKTDKALSINNDFLHIDLDKSKLAWNSLETNNTNSKTPYYSYLNYCDAQSKVAQIEVSTPWRITQEGALFTEAQATGFISTEKKIYDTLKVTLRVFNFAPLIEIKTQLHNPNRAMHPGGLWDLGDAGSSFFKSLSIITSTKSTTSIELNISDDADKENKTLLFEHNAAPVSIYQDSSGGENWNSRNHIDSNGKLTTQFRGYQVTNQQNIVETGNRTQPILSATNQNETIHVFLEKFWQNFPSALSFKDENICIDLFPDQKERVFELQGGERKTLTCYQLFSKDQEQLNSLRDPLIPTLAPTHYANTNAFPWFTLPSQQTKASDQLQDIINYGLNGEHNFFAKREKIDEFGWRNFGDIFADHETHYQEESEPVFISHYNNQYDAIYGFARQFTLSGDARWFQLMDDLATHVTDIDIYHTSEDRTEYNNGLFWHTDHYLDAYTSTHRTYTKHNSTSSVPGQTGGGPAAEHCYSTGLLHHYYLTGSEDSKNAVLELANWLIYWHEGTNGFLEQLLAIKKHDLPKLKAILKGEKPTTHTYPFTRGTGNYLNVMLDAWQLTNDSIWLARIESVIKQTIHPLDDLEKRDLLNAEVSWSYLVLLQAMSKYLFLKIEAESFDESYAYTLASFKHYTQWMLENERPFLEDPDQLEFPNDTWTAQDIRKVALVSQSYFFETNSNDIYINKINEWNNYIAHNLSNSLEIHYSRIIIILMQNYEFLHINQKNHLYKQVIKHEMITPKLTCHKLMARIIFRLLKGVAHFNIRKELKWLKIRFIKHKIR